MNIKELQKRFNTFKSRMDPETIEKEKRIERKKGIAKGFAIGSIIAGITALFLSPDSGKNNRRKAKEELEKAKDFLEVNLVEGKNKLTQVYEDTKEVIEDKKNVLTEKLKLDDDMNVIEEDFEETEEDFEETEGDFEEIEDEY